MLTQAEKTGAQQLAKSMSTKDLKWQIANAAKTGTAALAPIFKAELASREAVVTSK